MPPLVHDFDKVVSLLPAHHSMFGGAALLLFYRALLFCMIRCAKLALELVQQCGHMIVELREGQMRCMRKSRIFLHASAPAHEDGVTPGRKAARKCGQFTR